MKTQLLKLLNLLKLTLPKTTFKDSRNKHPKYSYEKEVQIPLNILKDIHEENNHHAAMYTIIFFTTF